MKRYGQKVYGIFVALMILFYADISYAVPHIVIPPHKGKPVLEPPKIKGKGRVVMYLGEDIVNGKKLYHLGIRKSIDKTRVRASKLDLAPLANRYVEVIVNFDVEGKEQILDIEQLIAVRDEIKDVVPALTPAELQKLTKGKSSIFIKNPLRSLGNALKPKEALAQVGGVSSYFPIAVDNHWKIWEYNHNPTTQRYPVKWVTTSQDSVRGVQRYQFTYVSYDGGACTNDCYDINNYMIFWMDRALGHVYNFRTGQWEADKSFAAAEYIDFIPPPDQEWHNYGPYWPNESFEPWLLDSYTANGDWESAQFYFQHYDNSCTPPNNEWLMVMFYWFGTWPPKNFGLFQEPGTICGSPSDTLIYNTNPVIGLGAREFRAVGNSWVAFADNWFYLQQEQGIMIQKWDDYALPKPVDVERWAAKSYWIGNNQYILFNEPTPCDDPSTLCP